MILAFQNSPSALLLKRLRRDTSVGLVRQFSRRRSALPLSKGYRWVVKRKLDVLTALLSIHWTRAAMRQDVSLSCQSSCPLIAYSTTRALKAKMEVGQRVSSQAQLWRTLLRRKYQELQAFLFTKSSEIEGRNFILLKHEGLNNHISR